jgi:hypothetical protein
MFTCSACVRRRNGMKSSPRLANSGLAFLMSSVLLLNGCATEIDWPRRQALDSLVGRSDRDVIDALGPASRSVRDGSASFLAYDYRHTEFVPGQRGQQLPSSEDLWLTTPSLLAGHCSTTFKLLDDKVVGWSLTGNDCAVAPYPSLATLEQQVLAKLQPAGVAATTDFPADPNTGSSIVEYGAFQRK